MKLYDNKFCEAWDASDNTVFLTQFDNILESLLKDYYNLHLQIKDNIYEYDEDDIYGIYRYYRDKAQKIYSNYFKFNCFTRLDKELLNCLIIEFENRLEKRVNRLLKAYAI